MTAIRYLAHCASGAVLGVITAVVVWNIVVDRDDKWDAR